MMGVPYRDPKTPPLELEYTVSMLGNKAEEVTYMVNVPPAISSNVSFPSRA